MARKSAGVTPPKAVSRVEPQYPSVAKEARVKGSVVVEISIDESGKVTSARALSGPAVLQRAGVAAALRWRFEPSLLGGAPVQSTSKIVFNFK
jgi:protein TonB